jgi:hypothetical protein
LVQSKLFPSLLLPRIEMTQLSLRPPARQTRQPALPVLPLFSLPPKQAKSRLPFLSRLSTPNAQISILCRHPDFQMLSTLYPCHPSSIVLVLSASRLPRRTKRKGVNSVSKPQTEISPMRRRRKQATFLALVSRSSSMIISALRIYYVGVLSE